MKQFINALKVFIYLTIVLGGIYPLFITLIAQIAMPFKANGSLLRVDGQIIGSALIAQKTRNENFFWPRPSAIDYNPMHPSGGSNLGPTSLKLKKSVAERKKQFGKNAPAELLYASGSGLDPHINVETAYYQLQRVAKARSIDEVALRKKIEELAEGKLGRFLGTRYVNVLLLNNSLDSLQAEQKKKEE